MYITWPSFESASVAFKSRSVMRATDPGKEWEREGHSPPLLSNGMLNDFYFYHTQAHVPGICLSPFLVEKTLISLNKII